MKKLFLLLAFLIMGLSTQVEAQRFAYVDTEYVLNQIPDYAEAQSQLDRITEQWQREIQNRYDEIDQLYRAYQAEEVILKGDVKKQREEEIINKERALKQFQKDKFGPNGELMKKKEELVKPIQDLVYQAVLKVVDRKGFDFIFDKSSGVSMLFANPEFDQSEAVLKELGVK